MFNKIKINSYDYELLDKNSDLNIKYFSDIQHTYNFDNRKLDKIVEKIKATPTNYVCIGGDIIDSTNHIRESRENQLVLLRFLEKIAKHHKTFIGLGNHDIFKKTNYGWDKDWYNSFWEEVNSINNVSVSCFNRYYEDESIIIYYPDLDFNYYENIQNREDVSVLWDKLSNDKKYLTNLDNNKVKVLLIHSPMLLDDPVVQKMIEEYDLVLCGHMHRGLMLPILNEIIKGNKGIISPYGELFPDYARGLKILKYLNKEIPLIISGGITKLSNNVTMGSLLNKIYPMEIENIKILTKKEK